MHIHLLGDSPLLPKAHASTLDNANHPKDKRYCPRNPVERTNRRARAGNIADL